MPTIAHIRLNTTLATRYAEQSDPRTAGDIGYVLKTALCEMFGEKVIRPYRHVIDEDDVLHVLGYLPDGNIPTIRSRPEIDGKKILIDHEYTSWSAEKNKKITLDVICAPQEQFLSRREFSNGDVIEKYRQRDVGNNPDFESNIDAYRNWFIKKISDPDTGCRLLGAVIFKAADHVKTLRKNNEGPKLFIVPRVNTRLTVEIINQKALERFLVRGIGRQLAFGFGSMFDLSILREFEAFAA